MDAPEQLLDEKEQRFILDVARTTVLEYVADGTIPTFSTDNPKLNEKRGAFVSLHEKGGALRGCIGYVEPVKPLLETVTEMAVACATRDPRFYPVTPDEFLDLDLEISVLTPPREIHDSGEINVGEHGLMIRKAGFSGLLLPQVATECGWDRIQFLRETCRKAGLEPDAWKDPSAKLYIFSAQVFSESLLSDERR